MNKTTWEITLASVGCIFQLCESILVAPQTKTNTIFAKFITVSRLLAFDEIFIPSDNRTFFFENKQNNVIGKCGEQEYGIDLVLL